MTNVNEPHGDFIPVALGTSTRADWALLERALPEGVITTNSGHRIARSDFMFMGTAEHRDAEKVHTIYLYKHHMTRRYLNVSGTPVLRPAMEVPIQTALRYWLYTVGETYREVHREDALDWVVS